MYAYVFQEIPLNTHKKVLGFPNCACDYFHDNWLSADHTGTVDRRAKYAATNIHQYLTVFGRCVRDGWTQLKLFFQNVNVNVK